MSDASDRRFSESHEWLQRQGGSATVGISEYAQSQLGDVIYLELPAVGQRLQAGEKFGVIESVKAASDLYAPATGEVSAVNEELKDHPEFVNQDPYGKGWILKLSSVQDNPRLLDQAAYQAFVEGQGH
jgi:glycine cleavage system H protein